MKKRADWDERVRRRCALLKSSLSVWATAFWLLVPAEGGAAYVRATSAPVQVVDVYANEWGSPFVTFAEVVNSVCAGAGRSLCLCNLEASPSSTQLRNNKMALIVSAMLTGRMVVLDYYYDPARSPGWDVCYIHGIYLKQ